jgi:hypothetical protein
MNQLTRLLTETFGITFSNASATQKMALVECIAFLMRSDGSYCLRDAIASMPEVEMPEALNSAITLKDCKEGLTLIALLYGGMNRDCSGVSEED